MRRSARSTRFKQVIQKPEDLDLSEDDIDRSDDGDSDLLDDSEEEWQPEKKKKKGRKRGREASQESEDDGESLTVEEEEEDDDEADEERTQKPSAAPREKKRSKIVIKGASTPTQSRKSSNVVSDQDILAAQAMIEAEEEEERQEQEAATKEAAELWERFRKRKQQGHVKAAADGKEKTVEATTAPASLTSWLGIPDPDWPTTCDDAMINDRDSLFVGYVYSLTTPSLSIISQLLSHLSKTVHPKTIPTDRLPPAMQHLASHRRGATHDMHAWRCLALKRGRSGLNGPEDFGLEEGLEDDGERFGAKEIAKVIKQLGATDVLVVVSRWYGGTMLGPVRFQHIENCARAALSQYLINEAMTTLKQQLRDLDDQLESLRSQLPGSFTIAKPQYDNLDPEKAERLIVARKKAIEMLKKRIAAIKSDVETAALPQQEQIESIPSSTVAESVLRNDPKDIHSLSEVIAKDTAIKKELDDDDDGDLTGWDALE